MLIQPSGNPKHVLVTAHPSYKSVPPVTGNSVVVVVVVVAVVVVDVVVIGA